MKQKIIFLIITVFALSAGIVFGDTVIQVVRVESKINSGFKERIYIDGKSKLTLANGKSDTITVPDGAHKIYAELYTLKTDEITFNAQGGTVQISVIANSLSDFTITLGGAAVIAAPAAPAKPAAAPAPAEPDTSRRSRRAERNNDTDADTGSMAAAPVLPAAGSTPAAPQKRQRPSGPPTIETALLFASDVMIENLEPDTTIAVVSIASRDIDAAEFVLDELAYIFVNTGNFKVVDRKSLEAIQSEQNFQTSGEVDDSSAVSIGKLLGANIVITGSVSGSGSTRRLRLKALDVKTAEIIAMASEAF